MHLAPKRTQHPDPPSPVSLSPMLHSCAADAPTLVLTFSQSISTLLWQI